MYIIIKLVKTKSVLNSYIQKGVNPDYLQKQNALCMDILKYIKDGNWNMYSGSSRKPKERFLYCFQQYLGLSGSNPGVSSSELMNKVVHSCASRFQTSESSVRSLLTRMSQRITKKIGTDTLDLLVSLEMKDLLKAELQFYVGTGQTDRYLELQYLYKGVSVVENGSAVPKYTLRECLGEILYLYRHSVVQCKRDRLQHNLDNNKLQYLYKLLNTHTAKVTEEQSLLYNCLLLPDERTVKDYIEKNDILN